MSDEHNTFGVDDRREKILQILSRDGRVKVSDLSHEFGISDVSIRLDLAELESKGLLERVHGGAISSYRAYCNMDFTERLKTNDKEKQEIATKIASMVENGDTLMINAGTTTLFIVRALMRHKELNIVTNSISIALEASNNANINVILLGGNINPKYQFTYGDYSASILKNYMADKVILSVDGVDAEEGLTTYYNQEADLCSLMLKRSNRTIIAADHTKIGHIGFAKIEDLKCEDCIVTGKNATSSELEKLEKLGVEIITV